MKKTKILFIIWTIIVVILIGLLTTLGFMLKSQNKHYGEIEAKLLERAKKYVDEKFLYPEDNETFKVTSKELIDAKTLDHLKYKDDACVGYVLVSKDGIYHYHAYIKCKNYTTKGYQK